MFKKRKLVDKKDLIPPQTTKSLFNNDYHVNNFIQYIDYPDLKEFANISDYFKQIIYFKHPGSFTYPVTNIQAYTYMFKDPEYICIDNSVNIRILKIFLQSQPKIRILNLSHKEINANIFHDLNLDNIEELVIEKFPKDISIQLFDYFKKLKK